MSLWGCVLLVVSRRISQHNLRWLDKPNGWRPLIELIVLRLCQLSNVNAQIFFHDQSISLHLLRSINWSFLTWVNTNVKKSSSICDEIIFPWQKFSSCNKGTVCNTFLCLWWRYNLKHFGSSTRERYSMTLYFIYKRNIFYDTFLHLWEEDSLWPNTHKLETKHS